MAKPSLAHLRCTRSGKRRWLYLTFSEVRSFHVVQFGSRRGLLIVRDADGRERPASPFESVLLETEFPTVRRLVRQFREAFAAGVIVYHTAAAGTVVAPNWSARLSGLRRQQRERRKRKGPVHRPAPP